MRAALAAPSRVKSPEAFRTISEVVRRSRRAAACAALLGKRFSQIKPVKRAGGRRYYRPEDVDLLRGIRSLLYRDGYTIKGVQKVLRDRGVRYVAEIGRGKTAGFGAPSQLPLIAESEDDSPARTALATLARMHAEATETLDEQRRVHLELLLAELLQQKARLRKARGA